MDVTAVNTSKGDSAAPNLILETRPKHAAAAFDPFFDQCFATSQTSAGGRIVLIFTGAGD